MPCLDLQLDCRGLNVTDVSIEPDTVTIHAEPSDLTAICPECGRESDRVHSRYTRQISDLPTQGKQVIIRLSVRRFRCSGSGCRRRVFCERMPELAAAHARTTGPLTESHREIGFALGGEAGARLAEKLAMPTSPDTLLRRVKLATDEPSPAPRYIGVDDWATKKGQHYGTILIDLERRQVIDILPGRDGEALKVWLKEHPGVEVITRDRWAAFAQAANEAAPAAKQVADRWHLLKNLREAVERLLTRFSGEIREAATETAQPDTSPKETGADKPEVAGPSATEPSSTLNDQNEPTDREKARHTKHAARQERYRHARELRAQGLTIRQIAERIGLSIKAVLRYLREDKCPDWDPGRQLPSQLDAQASFIDQWIADGSRKSADLFRLLRQQGCQASYDAVRRYLNRKVGSTGQPGPRAGPTKPPAPPPPSARKLSFQFIARPKDPKPTDESRNKPSILDRLREHVPVLKTGLDLAAELAGMLRKTVIQPLTDWLTKAEGSGVPEVVSFAASLREDQEAVTAAITEAWSNGQTEGQVNRLKLIKRTMYGRAGMPLLRARVRRKA
jgi:transposase